MSPEAKARELGAKEVQQGISWCWAKNFTSPEAGRRFVAWLEENGYEHRGYYEAQPESANEYLRVDGVRFR